MLRIETEREVDGRVGDAMRDVRSEKRDQK
jgi:hypothetical protein